MTTTLRHEGGYTVVCDDEAWSVRVLGRTGLEYRAGERVMVIDAEILAAPHGAAIYTSSVRQWQAPHDTEVLTDEDRSGVLDRVRRAFAAWGFDIDVY